MKKNEIPLTLQWQVKSNQRLIDFSQNYKKIIQRTNKLNNKFKILKIKNMNKQSLIENYQRRLKQLPQQDKELISQIRKYQDLVADQQIQLNNQNTKIKTFESQLIKLQKILQQRDNEIQQLNQSQEKNSLKEKKYFLQIQTYNKKIENFKEQINKIQKSIVLQKKQNKNIQLTISAVNSESKKVLSTLTKGQIKINTLTQTLNDLKLKLMQQHTNKGKENVQDDTKKDEKIISELFNAIKKQLALIDILKRQKVHVIASTQFEKVLQMNQQK